MILQHRPLLVWPGEMTRYRKLSPFDSPWKLGAVSIPCDAFDGNRRSPAWQANVRAIALGLEALRRVERYGIAPRGEQYTGWKALPPSSVALGAAMTVDEAARLLCDATMDEVGEDPRDVSRVASLATALWREAAKRHHPDVGGDPDLFRRLTEARDLLLKMVPA